LKCIAVVVVDAGFYTPFWLALNILKLLISFSTRGAGSLGRLLGLAKTDK